MHASLRQRGLRELGTGLLCLAVGACLTSCPGYAPSYAVEVTRDVVYGAGYVMDPAAPGSYVLKDLLLDVYSPRDADELLKPALLLIHGGNFNSGNKEKDEIVDIARFLARRGFVCFSMNYRLKDEHPPGPSIFGAIPLLAAANAAFVDTKAAIRWIRANAAEYGVDPDLIAVLGESAGAIAALTAAVTDPMDFATDGPAFPIPPENHPNVSPAVQGCIDLWGTADHVLFEFDSSDPPMMILHGTDDDQIGTPFSAAQRIHAMAQLHGIPHAFYAIEDAEHGAWNARVSGKGIKMLVLDFLNEYVLMREKI